MGNGTVAIDISRKDWDKLVVEVGNGKIAIDELCIIVKGKPQHKVDGLIQKVDNQGGHIKDLKELVEEVVDQRKQQKAIMVGVGIGIALNIITGGATLITLINALQTIAAAGVVP